jgi:hypothetical protein
VRHDGSTVLGDLHVQFQRGDTQLQRVGERRQAALRSQAQTTAVGLNVQRGPIGRAVRRTPRHGGHQRSDIRTTAIRTAPTATAGRPN